MNWIVVFIIILMTPLAIWFWQDQQAKEANILIIDKTVADGDLREHMGFTWLLNHLHIKKTNGQAYQVKDDYVGVVYKKGKAIFQNIPEDLRAKDLIYVADTYGVSEIASHENIGGLNANEWASIHNAVSMHGVPLIMEFNSISSPTNTSVRKVASHYLGFDQLGWTGRYFKNLSHLNEEIPNWLIKSYEKDGNRTWSFSGEGLVLIQEDLEVVQVLSVDRGDINQAAIELTFTSNGKKKFNLDKSTLFYNWFEVTTAHDNEDILANFHLPVTHQGQSLLDEWEIPSHFPAVIKKKQELVNTYYFAGDFGDVNTIPSFYQYSGFTKVRELLTFDSFPSEQHFFWKTYIPMMKVLLEDVKKLPKIQELKTFKPTVLQNSDGLTYSAKVKGNRFEVYQNGKWKSLTVKGVNIGMGKPGAFPGEGAITKSEYARWFKQIGEMNANTIRIYTLHPPAFYQALKEYNETHENPLYVFQGIWIDESPLEETLDAFTPKITREFQEEFKKITDVIHGNANVKEELGHAYGLYNADVSPYVIGWMMGIEWYPYMVDHMASKYANLGQYTGSYIQTNNATGFELWMAEQMDALTSYEAKTYKWTRPMSFTNWVSTDNINQPAEPFEQEDIASVDPNHIKYKENQSMPGMFASYHVYPYYPEFLNLDKRYTEYIDHRGEKNNYAGYLHDLKASHQMPILIAEFGIPASRGLTHVNPMGFNQGYHSEQEQGKLISRLYEDIIEEEMMGGLIFTWQDEWFKRTWNTMDLDDPNRRPFWSNAQTNEQHFGLLNFDRLRIQTDGQVEDWNGIDPVYQSDNGQISALYTTHDERYLYLRIDGNDSNHWLGKNKPQFLFDVTPISGNTHVNDLDEIIFDQEYADFWLSIETTKEASLKVDAYYDAFFYMYGVNLQMIKPSVLKPKPNSGEFNEIHLALSKTFTRPDTGEVSPFTSYETGELHHGNSNPASPNYDSLADYYYDEKTGILEMRIPWLLLNIKDPSSKKAIGDLYTNGTEATQTINDIGISLVLTDNRGKITQSFPARVKNKIPVDEVYRYDWKAWEHPHYSERLKHSYRWVQETFKNTP